MISSFWSCSVSECNCKCKSGDFGLYSSCGIDENDVDDNDDDDEGDNSLEEEDSVHDLEEEDGEGDKSNRTTFRLF